MAAVYVIVVALASLAMPVRIIKPYERVGLS
jgi:hypothetical protein